MTEKSCGTIPYTLSNEKAYYLLIKDKENGCCGFPKGHVEANETEAETAIRETFEETSISVTLNCDFRYETSYPMRNGNTKNVVYFLARFQDQAPSKNCDFEDFLYLLLPFEEAYRELTFENARQMLKMANAFLARNNLI